jgi:hypothetical protein
MSIFLNMVAGAQSPFSALLAQRAQGDLAAPQRRWR